MTIDYNKIIDDTLFIDEFINQPLPIISIQNKTIAVENSFISICGLPKSRKTTFLNYFLASAITGNEFLTIQVNIKNTDNIVIFDTEQSNFDFYRQMKFLKKLICKNDLPKNLYSYLFRQYDIDVILNTIYLIIQDKKPKLIIIDNITELVLNFNDPSEAKKLVQFLKKITAEFNTTIITLLHLGKGNLQSLGNLGSMVDRSANSILRVIYDKDYQSSTLEANMLRSDSHFEPITIQWSNDENNYVQINNIINTEKAPRKFDLSSFSFTDHINKLNLIFNNNTQLTYDELISEIKLIYGIGTNIAKQKIVPLLLDKKILFRIEKGIYILTPKKK